MKTILRQGDVLLVSIDQLPTDANPLPLEGGRVILAHGEVTGHAHAIETPVLEDPPAIKFEAAGSTFLEVLREVGLNHEEHERVVLPAAIYQVLIQTEYTPQEIRNVQD